MKNKIIVDLSSPILNLKGGPLFDDNSSATLGWTLAEMILSRQTDGDSVKLITWCYRLHEGQALELDESDYDLLTGIINKSNTAVLIRGQLIPALRKAKDIAEKAE